MADNPRYRNSNAMLARARKVIPLGTQTFSKSYQQFPQGSAPLFLARGKGGRVWDVDGNEYVDMISGLLPVLLGYGDPDVDAAIREQLSNGISFSLATELEIEVAELLTEIIPCAEMVRFGKNGSDATTGCVRVARAATGRSRLIVCGYHGWHDWYVAATVRNKGIPAGIADLIQRVPYNDIEAMHAAFRKHPGEVAAVILEPMNSAEPKPGYLAEVKELAHKQGALLVFDEIITGFRFALGGAQEHFGVTPDLAAIGKSMGNGMPISAVVGRADLMAQMEEVFFSSTFGGETLSLAAAKAVIQKMRREPVVQRLWSTGSGLAARIRAAITANGLDGIVGLYGAAPWTLLGFYDASTARKEAIKTLFMREMLARGVLIAASNNVTYAHTAEDMELVARAYEESLGRVSNALQGGRLESELGCPPIMPVFSVRQA
jgi:glutamate-1-semialdehyde 2,1-aminomutase/spore coat polysaccharide biosynthesis protein SpsF